MTVKIITQSPLLFLKLFFLTPSRVLNKTRKIEYYQSHTKYLHCCMFMLYLIQNLSVSKSIHSNSVGQVRYACMCSQSCPTLCNPMDCSPLGSSAHGTLQARILQCGAMFSSRNQTHISCIGRWILKWHHLEGARAQWTEPHTSGVSPALSPNHHQTTRVLSALIFHSSWY